MWPLIQYIYSRLPMLCNIFGDEITKKNVIFIYKLHGRRMCFICLKCMKKQNSWDKCGYLSQRINKEMQTQTAMLEASRKHFSNYNLMDYRLKRSTKLMHGLLKRCKIFFKCLSKKARSSYHLYLGTFES